MGYILDKCPSLESCCFSIPLRISLVIISLLGLIGAAFFIYAFTTSGSMKIEDMGVPKSLTKPLRYINGISGVLLCAVNVLLFLAAVFESDAFCEVYIWFILLFWLLYIIISVTITCSAIVGGEVLVGSVFFFVVFLTMIVSFYFLVIVANYRMTLP